MLNQSIYSYKDALDKEGIIFTFCGPISHDIVEGVGITLKSQMEKDKVDRTTTMKVFSIFIEQVQNVIHYSQERCGKSLDLGKGIIVIGKKENKHFIIGGNKISKSKASILESNLKGLALLNKDELKILYKKKRKQNDNEESKGAGIGFIEMARKSSEALKFSFEKIDEEYSFFSIEVVI